jgi:dolichol-phosphate mannosyltransferase
VRAIQTRTSHLKGARIVRSIIIIPTFNERENLATLVAQIFAQDNTLDILIIDDNSPDGSGDLADQLADADPRMKVMHRTAKLGLGTAYVAGFQYALAHGYERVVEMDADFSHRPEDLPALLAATQTADVVIGSRNIPGGRVVNWSPLRQVISKGGSIFARLVLRLPMHDCTSGFKVFRRRALERLDLAALRSNGYAFQVEVNYACARGGLRVAEVPILFPNRTVGSSKMSSRIVLEAAWLVIRLRTGFARPPLRSLNTVQPAAARSTAA